MKLRYTRPAFADLQDLADYIGQRSPQGARRVLQRIRSLIEQLPEQPYMGKRTEDASIRRLTALPYPYLIFYEVKETEIHIHAVRHAARDQTEISPLRG